MDSAEREGLRPNGNVPNLRFPEFRGEWEKVRLGEECNMLCGYAFNGEDIVEQGSYLLMRGINITEGSIRHSSELDRYYSGSIEKLDKYKLAIGDLVIGMDGSKVGRNSAIVSSYEDGSYLVQRVCRIRSSIGNNYILQFINNTKFHKYVDTLKTSSAIPHISLIDIKNYRISIPSTQDETDKIAKLFLLLDERIATQNKIIEDLKKLKSAIIEKVFNGKHPEKLQLNDVGSYIRGLTYSSNDVVEHGGTIVMRSNNIINGSLLDYNNNVVFVNKQMSAEQQLQNGDVVICMANGSSSLVGKSSFYDGSCHSPITVGAFCGIYRSKEPIVKWLFQTNKYRRYIWNSLQGGNGAIANLNGEDILNMSFPIPNATFKDTCVKMLTSVDSALENNMSLCALYTLQKQHMLRQMFI